MIEFKPFIKGKYIDIVKDGLNIGNMMNDGEWRVAIYNIRLDLAQLTQITNKLRELSAGE